MKKLPEIYNMKELVEWDSLVEINNKWVPSRPINYKHIGFLRKLKISWEVFRGKADAFYWPENQ